MDGNASLRIWTAGLQKLTVRSKLWTVIALIILAVLIGLVKRDHKRHLLAKSEVIVHLGEDASRIQGYQWVNDHVDNPRKWCVIQKPHVITVVFHEGRCWSGTSEFTTLDASDFLQCPGTEGRIRLIRVTPLSRPLSFLSATEVLKEDLQQIGIVNNARIFLEVRESEKKYGDGSGPLHPISFGCPLGGAGTFYAEIKPLHSVSRVGNAHLNLFRGTIHILSAGIRNISWPFIGVGTRGGREQERSKARRDRGGRSAWQPRYWEHTLEEEPDWGCAAHGPLSFDDLDDTTLEPDRE